ncbi:MAG TPA: hypothetical protein VGE16_18790 [Albitalea sp.]
MSADRHRGIRRQKQKRAKDLKRQARDRRHPDDAQRAAEKAPPAKAE